MHHATPLFIALMLAVACLGCEDRKARISTAQQDLDLLAAALAQYKADFNGFPDRLNLLGASFRGPNGRPYGPYTATIPTDPWGRSYVYHGPTDLQPEIELFSPGPDGYDGGGDDIYAAGCHPRSLGIER